VRAGEIEVPAPLRNARGQKIAVPRKKPRARAGSVVQMRLDRMSRRLVPDDGSSAGAYLHVPRRTGMFHGPAATERLRRGLAKRVQLKRRSSD
jgi:hypothetical protein